MGGSSSEENRDFSPWQSAPPVVFWELTRACDLRCRHCRAEAVPNRHPEELDTGTVQRGLTRLGEGGGSVVIFTGGDPFKRPDLKELVGTAHRVGLKPVLTPSATPLVTRDRLERLAGAGLSMIGLSLDGNRASSHDRFRGEEGSFRRTLRIARWVDDLGIPLQVNTTVSRDTYGEIRDIGRRLADWSLFRWALFFLVRTGSGRDLAPVDPGEIRSLYGDLQSWSDRNQTAVKTTNAPHFRRWQIEEGHRSWGPGMVEGDGVMFISHRGIVSPSGFLPVETGSVEREGPLEIYRNREPFVSLRERAFRGPCGDCEFRRSCGGSRAVAYARTGDPLGTDPSCPYLTEKQRDRAVSRGDGIRG